LSESENVIFGFLSLAYFIQYYGLQFYLFSCKWHNFTLLYVWIILQCMYIFIQSLIFEHLGWFHSLIIVNSVSLNMGVHAFVLYVYLHSFGYRHKGSTAGPKVGLFLTFWGNFVLISTMIALLSILTKGAWGFFFLYNVSNYLFCLLPWWLSFWLVWYEIKV
jgi:hypothetical protein